MKINPAADAPRHRRIACLCTEAVETLYAIGAADAVAGISGYTVYPPQARREKPKISGFTSARLDRILAVQPDLAVGFSNLQAELLRDLADAGVEVKLFTRTDLEGIFEMITTLAGWVARPAEGAALIARLRDALNAARVRAAAAPGPRPRVYFEEWPDPMIAGIGWVSELIAAAGGDDVFADLAVSTEASGRIIADPDEVVRRAPDLIIASWCGRKFRPETVLARPGWAAVPAVRDAAAGMVCEIKSADILAAGPVAILRGLPAIEDHLARWRARATQRAG